MNNTAHDFVTVDMRGLKASLVARARSERVSVSVLVRRAVVRDLGIAAVAEAAPGADAAGLTGQGEWVKLSIRMTRGEATQLAAGARAARLSRGAYLAGLAAGIPVLASGGDRSGCIAALHASCAELSTLSRNTYQLAELLRQGNVRQALEYRDVLDALAVEVRGHLKIAARVLAELATPRRRSARLPTAGAATREAS